MIVTCLFVNLQAIKNLQMTLLELGMISLIFFSSHFFAMTLVKIHSLKLRMQVFWPVALITTRTTGKPYSMGGLFIRCSETKSTIFKLFCVCMFAVKYTYGGSTALNILAAYCSSGTMRLKITYSLLCVVFTLLLQFLWDLNSHRALVIL